MSPEAFDYVIIGAGTAGCVLANRLSEGGRNSVCLVEAGLQDNHPLIHVPAGVAFTIGNPTVNWGYRTVPQIHADGRELVVPRGRVLGGSSSINGMVYFRGHPGDFDDWAAAGAPGWGYADVLPYFVRSEDNLTFRTSAYHGVGGAMAIGDVPRVNPLIDAFLTAADSLQLRRQSDFNGPDPEGFGTRQSAISKGRRVSGATAFLGPAQARANLTVRTGVMVRRILFEGRRAVAVEIEREGEISRIEARRETILSAGAYGSPAILLRSGIGDAAELNRMGIEPVLDLPGVGRGLRDHPAAPIAMRTRDTTSYGLSWRNVPQNLWTALRYLLFRTGPIASNLFEAAGFTRSGPGIARPDLQLIMMPAVRNATPFPLPLGHGYGILSVAIRPRSRGSVRLATREPRDAPLIDPNFLADPADLMVIRRGLELGRRLLSAPAFARYGAVEKEPGSDVRSADELEDHIRRSVVTVHHPACSCRMGTDPLAVVDATLKVFGTEGLKIADASIFPTLLAGNTNAAVVMVAEKAADLILGRPAPDPMPLPHAA